jgi:putative FmdB family regulatory protein
MADRQSRNKGERLEMPMYDFRCPSCGLEFEVSRPFSRASEPAPCPQDGTAAERVFTMPMTFVPGSGGPSAASDGGSEGPSHDHGHSHGPGGHVH